MLSQPPHQTTISPFAKATHQATTNDNAFTPSLLSVSTSASTITPSTVATTIITNNSHGDTTHGAAIPTSPSLNSLNTDVETLREYTPETTHSSPILSSTTELECDAQNESSAEVKPLWKRLRFWPCRSNPRSLNTPQCKNIIESNVENVDIDTIFREFLQQTLGFYTEAHLDSLMALPLETKQQILRLHRESKPRRKHRSSSLSYSSAKCIVQKALSMSFTNPPLHTSPSLSLARIFCSRIPIPSLRYVHTLDHPSFKPVMEELRIRLGSEPITFASYFFAKGGYEWICRVCQEFTKQLIVTESGWAVQREVIKMLKGFMGYPLGWEIVSRDPSAWVWTFQSLFSQSLRKRDIKKGQRTLCHESPLATTPTQPPLANRRMGLELILFMFENDHTRQLAMSLFTNTADPQSTHLDDFVAEFTSIAHALYRHWSGLTTTQSRIFQTLAIGTYRWTPIISAASIWEWETGVRGIAVNGIGYGLLRNRNCEIEAVDYLTLWLKVLNTFLQYYYDDSGDVVKGREERKQLIKTKIVDNKIQQSVHRLALHSNHMGLRQEIRGVINFLLGNQF